MGRSIILQTTRTKNTKRLSIKELISALDHHAFAEKVYKYRVYPTRWCKKGEPYKTRRGQTVKIRKFLDKDTGIATVQYSVVGSFYVVNEFQEFLVFFMHAIKIDTLVETHKTKVPKL